MARWAHADVLDNGPKYISDNCEHLHVIKAYSAGDSYATVTGNSICSISISSADITGANNSSNRRWTLASKSGTASANSGATPDLHLAVVDTSASKVLWVTDETSDQVVTSGNPVTTPSVYYESAQPTAP